MGTTNDRPWLHGLVRVLRSSDGACLEVGASLVAYSTLGRGMLTGRFKAEKLSEGDWRDTRYPDAARQVFWWEANNLISGWYKAKPDTWVTGYWEPDGGCCDNDVHDIFKCLEETALTNAFVVEQNDGKTKGYNCTVKSSGNQLTIIPNENIVNRVHVNLKQNANVDIHFNTMEVTEEVRAGEMKWITVD